jgi:hypothetical protein
MPVRGLCQPKELLNTRAHVDSKKTKVCIGRESNPGLADIKIADLEWQRPILPLNHQCNERAARVIHYVAWHLRRGLEPKMELWAVEERGFTGLEQLHVAVAS